MEGQRYTMTADGHELVVEAWSDDRNHARLLVDTEEVDTGDISGTGPIDLGKGTGHHVRVTWWWKGRLGRVALVEKGTGKREVLMPFAPPAGTRAARTYAYQQRHPTLYAFRHVLLNVGGTILAVLGVGALLRSLLPRIDMPDLDIGPPAWLRYLDPFRYLEPLFGWVPDLDLPKLPWLKYVIGFLVAVAIATEEAKRRKKRAAEQKPES